MGALYSQSEPVEPRHQELLGVMLGGVEDVAMTAQRLAMSPAEVAAWASSLDTRRAVAGVRMFADVQAELALSRLRVHAVNRLARLALDDDVPVETGRKAAHALLCVSVDRVAGRMPDPADEDEFGVEQELASIRAALFGPPESPPEVGDGDGDGVKPGDGYPPAWGDDDDDKNIDPDGDGSEGERESASDTGRVITPALSRGERGPRQKRCIFTAALAGRGRRRGWCRRGRLG